MNFSNRFSSDFRNVARILNLNMETGPWIAGGAVRSDLYNEFISDYDVYFSSNDQFVEVYNKLVMEGAAIVYRTENAITMHYRVRTQHTHSELDFIWCCDSSEYYVIQLVILDYYKSPQDVIDSFDFTVCQLITDGNQVLVNDNTFDDIDNKLLRINETMDPEKQKGMIPRIFKYVTYGFYIPEIEFDKILANSNVKWEGLQHNDYS